MGAWGVGAYPRKIRRGVSAKGTRANTLGAMHGMLSAAVMIAAYALVAVAAAYTAVKVIRGGPHDA